MTRAACLREELEKISSDENLIKDLEIVGRLFTGCFYYLVAEELHVRNSKDGKHDFEEALLRSFQIWKIRSTDSKLGIFRIQEVT